MDIEEHIFRLAAQLAVLRHINEEKWERTQYPLQGLPNHEDRHKIDAKARYGDDNDIENPDNWTELYARPTPPPGYLCFSCYQSGHFIQHCPKDPPSKRTPYQGTKQCIGEFKCSNCRRAWVSHSSLANSPERCKKCRNLVYPKKQYSASVAEKIGIFEKDAYKKSQSKKTKEPDPLNESFSSNGSWPSTFESKNTSMWSSVCTDGEGDWLEN